MGSLSARGSVLSAMAARRELQPPPSALIGGRWDVPEVGLLTLVWGTTAIAKNADRTWGPLRPPEHKNTHWSWSTIISGKPERFALLLDEEPLAIWCSDRTELLELPDGKHYRIDYLEVDPRLRGGPLGYFAFCTVASRADELGAIGMVFGSLPAGKLVDWYTSHGAEQRLAPGWKSPRPELVPFVIGGVTLSNMKEYSDALAHDDDEDAEG